MTKSTTGHKIASREEWLAARIELLKAEKALTRQSDQLAKQRQELPWVRIDKDYRFETDEGKASLAHLFKGRSQLLIYHFMFGPDYKAGCPSCSSIADGIALAARQRGRRMANPRRHDGLAAEVSRLRGRVRGAIQRRRHLAGKRFHPSDVIAGSMHRRAALPGAATLSPAGYSAQRQLRWRAQNTPLDRIFHRHLELQPECKGRRGCQ
jgi:hypothetical protein